MLGHKDYIILVFPAKIHGFIKDNFSFQLLHAVKVIKWQGLFYSFSTNLFNLKNHGKIMKSVKSIIDKEIQLIRISKFGRITS